MTYREAAIMFSLMQPCDAAKAIKATVDYYLYGTVPHDLDGAAAQVFKIMHADIDRNAEKYRQTVETATGRTCRNVGKRMIPALYEWNPSRIQTPNSKP